MIRKGTLDDLGWIEPELEKFANTETNKDFVDFPDSEYIRNAFAEFERNHVFLVCERSGEPSGFIVGIFNRPIGSPSTTILASLFWWVKEEHRGGRAGLELLRGLMSEGDNNSEVDYIALNLECDTPISDNTLERLNFRPYERSFIRRARHGDNFLPSNNGVSDRTGNRPTESGEEAKEP
jgi:hypothetical protein